MQVNKDELGKWRKDYTETDGKEKKLTIARKLYREKKNLRQQVDYQ